MTDETRITIGISARSKKRWSDCAKQLGVSQWEMADILLSMASPENEAIKRAAERTKQRKAIAKQKVRELKNKLKY